MKCFKKISILAGSLALVFSAVGCTTPSKVDPSEFETLTREIYDLGVKEGVISNLTYEQWLASIKGADGLTPFVGSNGNWWIGSVDTGVKAEGKDGVDGQDGKDGVDGIDGKDGTSMRTGHGEPNANLGIAGDSYIDLDSWDFYVKGDNGWSKMGNIKGLDGKDGVDGIDGTDGEDGTDGKDGQPGQSFYSGSTAPAYNLGRDGDSYLNYVTWEFFIKKEGSWLKVGKINQGGESQQEPNVPIFRVFAEGFDSYFDIDYTIDGNSYDFGYGGFYAKYGTEVSMTVSLKDPDHYEFDYVIVKNASTKDEDDYIYYYDSTFEFVVNYNIELSFKYKTIEAEESVVTIWTAFNYEYHQIVANTADKVKQKYGVDVNVVRYGTSYAALADEVLNATKSNNHPDMFITYPDYYAQFLSRSYGLDMTEYMNDPEIGWTSSDYHDIPESYIAEGRSYSTPGQYTLPFCKSTEGLYYNRDALIGINLSAIDPSINDGNPISDSYLDSLTWEELFNKLCPALAEYNESLSDESKILKNEKKIVGIDSDDNLFITLAKQYNLGYTSIDPVTRKAQIDFVKGDLNSLEAADGYADALRPIIKAYQDGYLLTKNTTHRNMSEYFNNGELLFCISSTAGAKYLYNSSNPVDIGIATVPQAEGSHETLLVGQGPSVGFLRHFESKNQAERARIAWLFYKELTSTETNTAWSINTGYMPIRQSVLNSDEYLEYTNISLFAPRSFEYLMATNAVYGAQHLNDLYYTESFSGSGQVRTLIGELMLDLLLKADTYSENYESILNSLFARVGRSAIEAIDSTPSGGQDEPSDPVDFPIDIDSIPEADVENVTLIEIAGRLANSHENVQVEVNDYDKNGSVINTQSYFKLVEGSWTLDSENLNPIIEAYYPNFMSMGSFLQSYIDANTAAQGWVMRCYTAPYRCIAWCNTDSIKAFFTVEWDTCGCPVSFMMQSFDSNGTRTTVGNFTYDSEPSHPEEPAPFPVDVDSLPEAQLTLEEMIELAKGLNNPYENATATLRMVGLGQDATQTNTYSMVEGEWVYTGSDQGAMPLSNFMLGDFLQSYVDEGASQGFTILCYNDPVLKVIGYINTTSMQEFFTIEWNEYGCPTRFEANMYRNGEVSIVETASFTYSPDPRLFKEGQPYVVGTGNFASGRSIAGDASWGDATKAFTMFEVPVGESGEVVQYKATICFNEGDEWKIRVGDEWIEAFSIPEGASTFFYHYESTGAFKDEQMTFVADSEGVLNIHVNTSGVYDIYYKVYSNGWVSVYVTLVNP